MSVIKYNWESGNRYSKLMLTGKSVTINKNRHVEYICDCGNIGWTRLSHIKSGATTSCRCEADIKTKIRETTHGLCSHPLHAIWGSMKARCGNKNNSHYKYYGGRGVIICDEWRNNFKTFYEWAIKNGWHKGVELDKDKLSPFKTGKEYSPLYCSFITRKENLRNTGQCRIIEYNGKIQNLSAWCEELNINYKLVHC
jgi:hypothetical protein